MAVRGPGAQGDRNRAAMTGKPRNARYERKMGTAFVHTVIDDHSRGAYAEIHDDETGHRVGCPPRDVQGRRSAG
ncbi:hypothetical protein GCM10023221_09120 [Luteimicrobium xylanilyticum]